MPKPAKKKPAKKTPAKKTSAKKKPAKAKKKTSPRIKSLESVYKKQKRQYHEIGEALRKLRGG